MVVVDLASGTSKIELVVHLEQHPRLSLPSPSAVVHADHGAADDVGGAALESAH